MGKSVIIIGAGIAGLCAGCYGQMNGYQTQIFEMHKRAGGLCTAWKRSGYTFDGCVHWLTGSRPDTAFYDWWLEVGALQDREIVDPDEYTRVEGRNGKTLIVYSDIDRLEQHLKDLSPADTPHIEELTDAARTMARHMMVPDKPQEIMTTFEKLKLLPDGLPIMKIINKFGAITFEEYLSRFSDPFLRDALSLLGLPDETPQFLIFTLATFHNRTAGYPIGGSKPFIEAIEHRYRDLGGEIRFKSRVEKILVEDDIAVGVRLEDGSEHRADVIVSAADARTTVFKMLDGNYIDDESRRLYETFPTWPMIQVSIGVARDLSSEPHMLALMLDEPVEIAGVTQKAIPARHYCCDPTIAPAGKSVITSLLFADYGYWKKLREQGAEPYEAEKEHVAKTVIAKLEQRFPGIAAQVEAYDIATPLTFERYTGNSQGSIMGWVDTPEAVRVMWGKGFPTKLPGLNNFHMIGQWTSAPGGLPVGVMSGRYVVQVLCHQDKKRFKTTVPFITNV